MATLVLLWVAEHHTALFCALGVFCGFLIHHTVFIHGEWHIQTPHIVLTHICIISTVSLLNSAASESRYGPVLNAASLVYWGYLPGIVFSIVLYRLFFHRLSRCGFPGPWYAPISKIYHVWLARRGQNHLVLDGLHKKYGDVIRTGRLPTAKEMPNISIHTMLESNLLIQSPETRTCRSYRLHTRCLHDS